MSPPVISLRGVSKTYWIYDTPADRFADIAARVAGKRAGKPFVAISDVSFDLERGETLGLIGRNGAGKSTLLQIIAGTVLPTGGDITIDGRLAAMIELGAGFNPDFTGRENIALAAALAGISTREVKRNLPRILEFADIGDFIDQPVKIYSSGMFARLAFAVAAHVDADILLVDEILSVGDAAFHRRCADFLERFKQRGSIIFTSHSLQAVQAICKRAVWLDHGGVRAQGAAEDVCAQYLAETVAPAEKLAIAAASAGASASVGAPSQGRHGDEMVDLFPFDPGAEWFGQGGARVEGVQFVAPSGVQLDRVAPGETVELRIRCRALTSLARTLVGFQVQDEQGQTVFGQNTHAAYQDDPFQVGADEGFRARFEFVFPRLRAGLYSLVVAITDGTQLDNVHHQWITDAMFIRVSNSWVFRGVAGVQLKSVETATETPAGGPAVEA